MDKRALLTTLVPIALIALVPAAGADEPNNIVKYRKNYMTAIGGHVGAIAQLVKGEYTAEGHLEIHAGAVAAQVKDIEKMFPEGTEGIAKTHALPAIWEDWDAFVERAREAEEAAQAFQAAVASGDPGRIGKGLKDLGGACKGCHDDFKEED